MASISAGIQSAFSRIGPFGRRLQDMNSRVRKLMTNSPCSLPAKLHCRTPICPSKAKHVGSAMAQQLCQIFWHIAPDCRTATVQCWDLSCVPLRSVQKLQASHMPAGGRRSFQARKPVGSCEPPPQGCPWPQGHPEQAPARPHHQGDATETSCVMHHNFCTLWLHLHYRCQ